MKKVINSFIDKMVGGLPNGDTYNIMCLHPYFTDTDIVRETEKAYLITMTFENMKTSDEFTADVWVPKSCTEEIANHEIKAKTDFAIRYDNIGKIYDKFLLGGSAIDFRRFMKSVAEGYVGVCKNAYMKVTLSPEEVKAMGDNNIMTRSGYFAAKENLKGVIKNKLQEMLDTPKPIEITENDYENIDAYGMAENIDEILQSKKNKEKIIPEEKTAVRLEMGDVFVRISCFIYNVTIYIGVTDTGRKYLHAVGDVKTNGV